MAFLTIYSFFSCVALFTSYTLAQLTGSLTYDGEQTIQITLENPSQSNLTFPGTNNLFDRQNLMAYAPITLANFTGAPVTLNGTRYAAPPLSDDVFQDIPAGGSYVRNLNMSEYLLLETSEGTAVNTVSQCFSASLPPSLYGLNVTGITTAETIASYFLSKGLQTITIQSIPIHFNYTVPSDFTPDQAAAIKNDANQRRLAGAHSTAVQSRGTRRRRS